MDITKFNEKFNRLEGNVYTFEEIIRPINGVYEAELIHDNVETSTINIYTGSKLTGDKINTYTISTPSLTPWRTHIKIFSNISPLYISYEFTGDTVEAEDINNVQDAINDTQKELNKEVDRATNKEAELSENISSEVIRATNKESALQNSINNEATRAKSSEKTLTDNLSKEVNRATNEETNIKNDINTNRPNWNDAYNKRHTHSNKSILDNIVQAIVDKWNSAYTHISDTVKHITSTERTLWNTVSDKYSKSGGTINSGDYRGVEIKRTTPYGSSILYSNTTAKLGEIGFTTDGNLSIGKGSSSDGSGDILKSDRNNNRLYSFGKKIITEGDFIATSSHSHSNKSVLDKINQNLLNAWNDGIRKVAFVGSDAENSNGWYKVASQTCSSYGNTNITFMVTSTFGKYNCGILQLQMRSDNTKISCARFSWLTRTGFDIRHFIIVIDGMTWTLYAYQPSPRYGRIAFEILSLSNITGAGMSWTLNFASNSTKEATTPKATVTSYDSSAVSTATKAIQDSDGKQINTTYVKKGMTWNELEEI